MWKIKEGDLVKDSSGEIGIVVSLSPGSETTLGAAWRIYFPHIYGRFMIFWEKELEVISELNYDSK